MSINEDESEHRGLEAEFVSLDGVSYSIVEEMVKCPLEGLTKSKAIRLKDQMHSSSTSQFFYYLCDVCEKWHVQSTGEPRARPKKKTRSPIEEG